MAGTRAALSQTYSTDDAARIVGLAPVLVRALARDGVLHAAGDGRGGHALPFAGLRVLQAARQLVQDQVPRAEVRRALRALHRRLGAALTTVHLEADGVRVLVREGGHLWEPETGQLLLPFRQDEPAPSGVPLPWRRRDVARGWGGPVPDGAEAPTAQELYEYGDDVEAVSPTQAQDCYRRAIQLDPAHGGAHFSLGRLLHEEGRLLEAAEHYARALAARPEDATAAYNLGVALVEIGQAPEALVAFERAVAADPACADAHAHLARLYERLGHEERAVQSLMAYRRLTRRR